MSEPWEDFQPQGATTADAPSPETPPWEDFKPVPLSDEAKAGLVQTVQKEARRKAAIGLPFAEVQPGGEVTQRAPDNNAEANLAEFKSLPGRLSNAAEDVGAAILNYPVELWRADTGTPRQFVVKKDENGKDQLVMKDKPLPFQPGVSKLEDFKLANEDIDPVNSLIGKLVRGAGTPGMIITLPAAESDLVKGYFLTQTAPAVAEGAAGAMDKSKSTKERVESGLSGAMNGLFSYLLAMKGVKTPGERLANELNATPPSIETPPEGASAAPVVQTVSKNPWDDFKQPTPAPEPMPVNPRAVSPEPVPEPVETKLAKSETVQPVSETKTPETPKSAVEKLGEGIDFATIQRPHLVGVEAGLNLTPDDVPAIEAMQKASVGEMTAAAQSGDNAAFQTLMGKNSFLGGVIEAARRKGPNYDAFKAQKPSPPPEEPTSAPATPPAETEAQPITPAAGESGIKFALRPDGTRKTKEEYTPEEWKVYTDSVVEQSLTHGDEVHATMPDGKEVKGHIIGSDDAGNAVLLQQSGKTVTLPEKLTEVSNANPEQKTVEVLRNPSPRTPAQVAEGKPGEVQQPAGVASGEKAGLSEAAPVAPPEQSENPSIKAAANTLANRLERLKSGISNGGQLHAFGVAADLWDRAVSVAQAIIRAGGTAAEAIQAAIEHIKSNHQGDFDHNGASKAFTDALTVEEDPKVEGQPETFGIAQRVREARVEAGQAIPVPAGQGIAPEASVGRGRQLLAQGADPEKALSDFEATKRFSSDDIALVRARGEQLAQMAKEAEQKFGTDSDQYRIAWHLLADWDTRSKAMQTEWHKSGQAQQGETAIDTGTFTGLQRAYHESSGKEFTPDQAEKAKKIANDSKNAEVETEQAKQKLFETLDEQTKAKGTPKKEEPIEPHVRLVADKLKAYFEDRAKSALDRIKQRRAEGRLFTGIDPADLADYADYGASKILQKGLEVEKMSEEWAKEMVSEIGDYIKPHLETIWKASQKMFYEGFKKNIGIGEQASKVKKVLKSDAKDSAVNADKKALEAAQKTVREAAVKVVDAEVKARSAAAKAKKDVAEVQLQAAQKALEAATKRSRDAATKLAESENKRRLKQAAIDSFGEPGSLDEVRKMISYRKPGQPFTPEQVRAIWSYARRTYIEKGITNFDDIRNNLATDLGVSVHEVTQALAAPKGAKRLTDTLWKKQQAARRVQQQAREFIRTANMPLYLKALSSIPKILFGLKVGFHGTVALGTHAPFVLFQPPFWKMYFQDFAKMYKMVGSPALYEMEVQNLARRPNYVTATRAGLVNDPFKVEDFNNPLISQYLGAMTGMGNRGYFILKILRQDMFDQMWDQLPDTTKVPEVAQAIADGINHATGVIQGSGPKGASLALFAPRLEFSRVAWLAVDPAKALMSVANWQNATPAEKIFAINQMKEKAWVAGTLFGMLALNAGILNATGSNQKINFNDPMRSDFLKFKGAGMQFSYGNAMLSMARLPVRLYQIRSSDGGKLKNLIYPDEDSYTVLGEYGRSQLSPFASLLTTLWLKSDWENRPLPNSERPMPKRLAQQGIKPYTWTEFLAEQTLPIPLEEAAREVWKNGLGMNPEQISAMRKALATIAVMSATGGRLTEDTAPKKQPQLSQ